MLNKFCYLRIWILFLGIFYSFFVHSQNQTQISSKELVQIAEDFYGTDDRLINGTISHYYTPIAQGHPFFINSGWQAGIIFSNGIKFNDLVIKYNIESDDIFFINVGNRFTPTTILDKSLIDSVLISNRLLINTDKLVIKNPIGFVELLHRGKSTSFLKHKITKSTKLTDTYEYVKFNIHSPKIYIIKDSELVSLKSKKDLISEFSLPEKSLSKFLRQNKIQFKKANRKQLIQLIKYCDEQSFN
jgi:hypothetical protein